MSSARFSPLTAKISLPAPLTRAFFSRLSKLKMGQSYRLRWSFVDSGSHFTFIPPCFCLKSELRGRGSSWKNTWKQGGVILSTMKRGVDCCDNQKRLPNILEQYQVYSLKKEHLPCLADGGNAVSLSGLYKFALSIGVFAFSHLSPHCTNAFAGSVNWVGSFDSSWHTNENWVWDGHTPTSSDDARIDASPTAVISASPGAVANLFVGVVDTGGLSIENHLTSTTVTLGYNLVQ